MNSRSSFLPLRAALALAFSLSSVGCGSSTEKAVEEITEEAHPIDLTGALSVRNSLGSIRIYGSDDAGMKLKTIKRAWSASQLSGIASKVSVKGGSVSLETSFPPQKTWGFSNRSGAVDYAISLPRSVKISRVEIGNGDVLIEGMEGDLRANLVNGVLALRNCFGNSDLSVANGGLDLFFEKWTSKKFSVDANIISGNVRAFLPGQASYHLIAEALNGNVVNHLPDAEGKTSRRATKVSLSVGAENGSEISIRATSGNIEIGPAKAE